jgi:hypothetical protein
VRDRDRLSAFFTRVYPDFIARRRAADVYKLSVESLDTLCASSQVIPVGAEENGEVVAVSLFGWTKACGDFLYNVSLPGAERYSAALIWEGVRHLIEKGVPVLNLGGGVVEGDTLDEFKRRFGGEARPLESVRQIYRPDVYEELCRRLGTEEQHATGYFPAYRSPRVSVA